MIAMSPTAVTVTQLPVEPDALQAFELEQNRLACVLWEQLEALQYLIAQANRARSASVPSGWRVRRDCLNRQEMRYARRGVHLPRATLCEWKLAPAGLLEVLLQPLRAHQLLAPRMHVDLRHRPARGERRLG